MSGAVYGLGAVLFFLGYFLFELPSNLILERVGARAWFARIMVTWGAVTVLLGFAESATAFYVLRFLLGVAEAGFFPGVRSEEHTSELQSLMRISYAVFCLKKKHKKLNKNQLKPTAQ